LLKSSRPIPLDAATPACRGTLSRRLRWQPQRQDAPGQLVQVQGFDWSFIRRAPRQLSEVDGTGIDVDSAMIRNVGLGELNVAAALRRGCRARVRVSSNGPAPTSARIQQ